MRRVSRWASWVCLALSVGALGIGVVSLWYVATIRYDFAGRTERHAIDLALVYGDVRVSRITYPAGLTLSAGPGWDVRFLPKWRTYLAPFQLHALPRWSPAGAATGVRSARLAVPLWMVIVPCAGAGAWLFLRSRAPAEGHCPCGYDLAGVSAGAVCPECGRAPE